MDNTKTYSMQLRLKRTIIEDCYVSVPVTNSIKKYENTDYIGF